MTRCLSIVALVAATTTTAFAQFVEPGPDAKRVRWGTREPLATLADPNTPEVIAELMIERDFDARYGQLELMVRYDAIFVADVTSIESRLTPEGNWARSIVIATVDEVFKRPQTHAIVPGGTVTWRAEGGQVVLGETRITAVYPDEELLRESTRYLIFGWVHQSSSELRAGGASAFELTDEGWRSLALGDLRRNMEEIEEMNPEDVLRQLRALLAEQL